jgi:dTMP kinase
VGDTRPDLTLLFTVSQEVSAQRLRSRQATLPFVRDRIEEGDRAFFARVVHGYEALALAEPQRIKKVDGNGSVESVHEAVWRLVQAKLPPPAGTPM